MSTTTIPAAARDYLKSVRKGLADLPPEDAEEVLQDLEAHVAELGEIDPATELGTPDDFIKEFPPVPVSTSNPRVPRDSSAHHASNLSTMDQRQNLGRRDLRTATSTRRRRRRP